MCVILFFFFFHFFLSVRSQTISFFLSSFCHILFAIAVFFYSLSHSAYSIYKLQHFSFRYFTINCKKPTSNNLTTRAHEITKIKIKYVHTFLNVSIRHIIFTVATDRFGYLEACFFIAFSAISTCSYFFQNDNIHDHKSSRNKQKIVVSIFCN